MLRHKPAYGLILALRAQVLRTITRGGEVNAGLLRELAGRIPTSEYADLERRILRNVGSSVLSDSPLDESEVAALFGDLAVASAFDALLAGGATVAPLRTRLGVVSQAISGDVVVGAEVKTVSRIELDGESLTPQTALAIVVLSEEFATLGLLDTAATIEAEVVKSSAVAADSVLIDSITAGSPASAPSTGVFSQDVRLAFGSLPDNGNGRYYALCAPRTVRELSAADDGTGVLLYPDIDAGRGGPAGGACRVIPCSALATSATAGPDMIVLDATQLALGGSRMAISLSREAALDMRDSPNDEAANLVSLFQVNALAIRAERAIAAKLLREEALFIVTGAFYSEAAS